jgi:hypothetical protein
MPRWLEKEKRAAARAAYRSGFECSGGGVKVTVVSHLRQAKMSKC